MGRMYIISTLVSKLFQVDQESNKQSGGRLSGSGIGS